MVDFAETINPNTRRCIFVHGIKSYSLTINNRYDYRLLICGGRRIFTKIGLQSGVSPFSHHKRYKVPAPPRNGDGCVKVNNGRMYYISGVKVNKNANPSMGKPTTNHHTRTRLVQNDRSMCFTKEASWHH